MRKYDNIKIYPVVRFLCMENVNDQNCYRVQFDFKDDKKKKNYRPINYEQSKRFMFGSLLCFTHDKFVNVIFGKVAERSVKDLEKGQIIVGFDDNVNLPTAATLQETPFLMVESSVFFEPYFHVLNVLKKMDVDNFPMERYIIDVQTQLRPPNYLLRIDPLFYKIQNEHFWPLDWDNRTFYNLNESQQKAFKAALTQEFVIIQGPPGTGKTFLGLKIARTLIENSEGWYKSSPLLVICFTNHALDQFLEGLIGVTKDIVRVGGQSKNKNLEKFNIRNKRDAYANPSVMQRKREVKSLLNEVQSINESLRLIEEGETLIEFNTFYNVIPNFDGSLLSRFSNDEIIKWLFNDIDRRNFRRGRHHQLVYELPGEEQIQVDEQNAMEVDGEEDENVHIDEVFEDVDARPCHALMSIKQLREHCNRLENHIANIKDSHDRNLQNDRQKMEHELREAQLYLDYLVHRLSQFTMEMEIPEPAYVDLEYPHLMDHDSRWQLYFHWLCIYIREIKKKKEKVTTQFKKAYRVYSELRDIEDVQAMKSSLVVGMTTTGAARLRSSLQTLKSPIVIVEEAAEVLEAHIITSLTKHCQHLILIGDHQQLKPSTADFRIERKFLLGISLFERMVLNKIQCYALDVQHRMRPEISSLICPLIYPNLKNHESVMNRPEIFGIDKSVFFINHNNPEEVCNDNSKKNVHEAKFLIELARHLILNNYKAENITILAAYLGQMFELRKERKKHQVLLQDVRIAVLDNYQGEESDIILLSLVRNNKDNNIGFLKIENRVCVALSRARNGFYVMGNMDHLTKASELWIEIKNTLEKHQALGPHLTLQCQVHQYKYTPVACAEDFLKIPEGGCDLLCESLLRCGHTCKSICHAKDREHLGYKCQEPCAKILCEDPAHICTKYCYANCGPCYYKVNRLLDCGHIVNIECHIEPATFKCTTPVITVLPCGHETLKPCSNDANTFLCPFPCDTRVEPCGHACKLRCHIRNDPDHLEYKCLKRCEKIRIGCSIEKEEDRHICPKACYEECVECDVEVRKARKNCSHVYNIACKVDVDAMDCRKPCKTILPCGHKCLLRCHEPCGPCEIKVEKTVPGCEHKIKIECSLEPDRKYCAGKCSRPLPCGHKCEEKCNDPCTQTCRAMAECSIISPCGHTVKQIPCHLKDSAGPEVALENCNEKCNAKLKCDHTCAGTCGKCDQGRIHVRCTEKCGVPLICNHECPISCRQNCKPCKQKCEYYCGHSKCGKECGVPCTTCKEPCRRICKHQKCTRRCSDICTVKPCSRPCEKKLRKCGHPCVGFCGEPCPTLCRICDYETLTEAFLGNEDEEDAIYVMLEDCKHIFESSDLDRWMQMEDKGIKAKVCPRCTKTITRSQRYNEILRQNMKDLVKVKVKSYGNPLENENTRIELEEKLMSLVTNGFRKYFLSVNGKLIQDLQKRLAPTKVQNREHRRQDTNRLDLQAINAKVEVLEMLVNVFKTNEYVVDKNLKSFNIVNSILNVLMRSIDSTTDQEIDDVMMEIHRLTRCVQYEKIQKSPNYAHGYSFKPEVKSVSDTIKNSINNIKRYDLIQDAELKNQLQKLKESVNAVMVITEAEKREIVSALKLTPGHWYKCPKGHPYIITECGGANQISKCNECGSRIGGTNHQLLSGNTHTGEFDGSRYSAWSEQANLANYGRAELF